MDKNSTVGNGKIRSLFDAGTFVEIGAYVKKTDTDAYDGMICGYGAIFGKLVFAFAQDMDRMKGAFGASGASKLRTMYNMAIKNGAPVVGIFESAGAVVYDGSAAPAAYGSWLKCVSDASGVVPQVALISGVCGGTASVVASMFDFIVAVKDQTQLYLNTPNLLGKESASAEAVAADGLAALVCEDEGAAVESIRKLIEMLPSNNRDASHTTPDDVNRVVTGDISAAALADFGRIEPLYEAYAPEMKAALGYMGGELVAFVQATGALTVAGARKATKMITFCDSFRIPVVTLVDSEGVSVSADEERSPASAAYARLACAYASATTPRVTVITGKAYGSAFALMGSRALGADLVLALPEARVGAMTPEMAVAFVWNDKVTNDKSRSEVEQEWIEAYALPEKAAAAGDIDDIVSAAELRMRICSAIYMLATAAQDAPTRRHTTSPM